MTADFHALVAQIIPVLLLALIVDTRLLSSRPTSYDPDHRDDPATWNVSQTAGLAALTLLLVVGECAALWGAAGGVSPVTSTLSVAGLMAALLAVVTPVLARQLQHWRAARRDTGTYLLALFVVVAGLSLIIRAAAGIVSLD